MNLLFSVSLLLLSASLCFAQEQQQVQPPAPIVEASPVHDADTAPPADNAPCCGVITPEGRRLIALLDSMDVEHHWLPHERIHWQSGDRDNGPRKSGENYTSHCSGFAAAVSVRVRVYLLRPPEHAQTLLANAQGRWLGSEKSSAEGWRRVDAAEAQRLANQGEFVVVNFMNPNPHQAGHIAVIRPSEKTAREFAQDGPEDTQAGGHNHDDWVVRRSFSSHPGAWPDGVRYYAHKVDWSRVNGKIDPADLDDSMDSGTQP